MRKTRLKTKLSHGCIQLRRRQNILLYFCIIVMFVLAGCTDFQQDKVDTSSNIAGKSDEIIQLDIETVESQTGGDTFNISLTDFIESFNSYYMKANNEMLLKGLEEWDMYDVVLEPDDNDATTCYAFSENMDVRALPQLHIYADNTKSGIRQISMCYDIHSFSPETYELYEELCYYVIRTMVTDATDEEVKEDTSKLLDALDESFTTDKASQGDESKYIWGPVGAYPYYVVGETMEIRIVPVKK